MVDEYFYIIGTEKLNMIRALVNSIPSARFNIAPYSIGGACWHISVSYKKEDMGDKTIQKLIKHN